MSNVSQNRYAYPKYKVFIFGVEITADVVSITTTQHDGAAPNTCQITLLNEHDKYIISTDDLVALKHIKLPNKTLDIPWMTGIPTETTNIADGDLTTASPIGTANFASTVQSLFQAGAISKVKRDILLKKNGVVQNVPRADLLDPFGKPLTSSRFNDYYSAAIEVYPLTDGSPIFHPMDPVRVFMRDPFNPARWYYHFTGFVSDMVDGADQNNQKTLTLVVEDPTKLFRYTRVFINPGIIDANVIIEEKTDFRVQSFYASFLKGMTLPEIFFTLVFGPDRVGAEKLIQKQTGAKAGSNITTRLRGIGHFSFDTSGIFSFGPDPAQPSPQTPEEKKTKPETKLLETKPEQRIEDLSQWQSILDHEVQPGDIYVLASDDLRGSIQSTLFDRAQSIYSTKGIEGIIQELGEHPETYLVDGGRLLLLVPRSLGVENRDIVMNDIIQSYPLNSEWHSAGTVLSEVVDRVQFVMYCSPRGDVIVEPPLYDFNPQSFGLKPVTSNDFIKTMASVGQNQDSGRNATTALGQAEVNVPGTVRGPFGLNYVIRKRDTYHWEFAFVDEKVHNIAVAPKSIFHNYDNLGNTSIIGDLAVVKIPHLIPLYGVRQIPLTPRGYISTDEGARAFCHITLNKLNADAHTMKVEHVPNIKMWLNRPIYIQGRNCLGTVKQISQAINWGESGDMTTSTDLFATRFWSGAVSTDKADLPVYSTIGGFAGSPWNYAIMFGKQKKPKIPETGTGSQSTSAALSEASGGANKTVQDVKDNLSGFLDDVGNRLKGVK